MKKILRQAPDFYTFRPTSRIVDMSFARLSVPISVSGRRSMPESMFSVYSTSPVGILGAMVRTTDVEAILGIDCNVTDFYAARPYPVHLYYNPYKENKTVTYTVSGEGPVDLFDIISRKYLAENASGTAKVTLPADNAAVIVEVPAGTDIVKSGDRLVDKSDNNKIISYR